MIARGVVRGCAVVLFSVSAAAAAVAQSPSPSPVPPLPDAVLDLEIDADVSFRELRFETVGTPRVEFSGTPDRKTVWEAERRNLPKPVQPGVVYRDGGVHLTISSRFEDLVRLFAEDPAPAEPRATSPSPMPSASPSPPPPPRSRGKGRP
jgi:hypothetical protein